LNGQGRKKREPLGGKQRICFKGGITGRFGGAMGTKREGKALRGSQRAAPNSPAGTIDEREGPWGAGGRGA